MDAWGHMLFAFAIAIGLGIYPIEKVKGLFGFMVGVMFINFLIALAKNPIYNGIGVILRAPVIGYLLYKRSTTNDPLEKAKLEQLSAVLFAATYISAASHAFDQVLHDSGYVVEWHSMWRGHNLWHSPFTGIVFSFLIAIIFINFFRYISKKGYPEIEPNSTFNALFFASLLGYLTHIIADVITYDFQVFWLFPFHDYHFSGEDIVNHGIMTEDARANKPEGTVYYWSIPFFAFVTALFTAFKFVLNSNTVQKHLATSQIDNLKSDS